MKKSKQVNITMAAGEEQALQALAEKLGTVCRYGSSAGKITWREMFHQIAWGHLVVSKPGQSSPSYEKKSTRKKRGRDKPYKAYPNYPHKWWKPDMMNMMRVADVVEASGWTAEELEAGGLRRIGDEFMGLEEWNHLCPDDESEPEKKA